MAPKTEDGTNASDSDDVQEVDFGDLDYDPDEIEPMDRLIGEIPTHPPTAECPDAECMVCAVRDCPYNEPLHYDGDGCPACYTEDTARTGE